MSIKIYKKIDGYNTPPSYCQRNFFLHQPNMLMQMFYCSSSKNIRRLFYARLSLARRTQRPSTTMPWWISDTLVLLLLRNCTEHISIVGSGRWNIFAGILTLQSWNICAFSNTVYVTDGMAYLFVVHTNSSRDNLRIDWIIRVEVGAVGRDVPAVFRATPPDPMGRREAIADTRGKSGRPDEYFSRLMALPAAYIYWFKIICSMLGPPVCRSIL